MTKIIKTEPSYRNAVIAGLGEVQIPEHMSDAEVLAEVMGKDAEATPKKKTKKKP
jgi:hypothetical protein